MPNLTTAFTAALGNIEPSKEDWDIAPAAHDAVGTVLTADTTLKDWGINPILIGSYGRQVSIRRVYDVDMFCRLDDFPSDVRAATVLNRVYDVLGREYGKDAVTKYDRSVTVLVPDAGGLFIDVVPAREAGDVWEIPTRDGSWQATNPTVMTDLKEDKNAEYDELYVPCVKLLRQVRRAVLGKAKPGGFAVEMALFTACEEGLVFGDSMSEFFTTALERVADVFARIADEGFEIPDPSMPGINLDFNETTNWQKAKTAFQDAADKARRAFDMPDEDTGKAARLVQEIFGSNDDFGQVFPMPAGYDKDGNKRSFADARKPGDSKVPAGDLRFG